MTVDVAARAGYMTQVKVIRRVRTEAGVRRYKQPLGSIIINDGLLIGLTEVSSNPKTGFSVMQGANGKKYSVGLESTGNGKRYVAREGDVPRRGRIIRESHSELDALAEVGKEVQEDAGLDTRLGPARIGSAGNRGGEQTWSKNQVDAISEQVHMWGNTAVDSGNGDLADDLWRMSAELDEHGDVRLLRHQLEEMRAKEDPALDGFLPRHRLDTGPGETFRDVIGYAIDSVITEGKLPKRYDHETEAAYAASAGERAAERASKPIPIKTSELSSGQWVRSVDADGKPQSDWFQIYDIGEQSVRPGVSRIVRGKTRDGKKKTYYRQGGRNKWETIGDPTGQPTYEDIKPEKPYAIKKVHNLSKGDRISWDGKDAYVQDYIPDKDDFSTPERRKNPVYKVSVADDEAGKVNLRRITIPRGTQFGPSNEAKPVVTPSDDSTIVVKPQVEGADAKLPARYESAVTFARGTLALTDRETNRDMAVVGAELGSGNITADEAIERLRVIERRTKNSKAKKAVQGAIWAIENVRANSSERKPSVGERAAVVASTPDSATPKTPKLTRPSGGLTDSNVQKVDSEYPDYEKYVGDNGRSFYLEDQGDGTFAVLDEDDNELADGTRQQVFAAMAKLGKGTTTKPKTSTPKAVADDPALSNLRAASSEYTGWEKFLSGNDTPYYIRKEGSAWVAVDDDDNDVVPVGTRASVLAALDKLAAPRTAVARATDLTKPRGVKKAKPAGLKKVANAFEGWDRYKGDDGKTYDVGYDETDNRWYVTGKGGWDEVVADAETRDAVIEKLSAVASPDKPPTTFAPNTPKVVPQTSPITGMTAAQVTQARNNRSDSTVRAVTGSNVVTPAQPKDADRVAAADLIQRQIRRMPDNTATRNLVNILGELNNGSITIDGAAKRVRSLARTRGDALQRRQLNITADVLDRQANPPTEDEERARIRASAASANTIRIEPGTAADVGQSDAERRSTIQEAQTAANIINQRAKLTPKGLARQEAPSGSMLRDLDTGNVPVLRNGKPLKPADHKLLNTEGNNGRAKNRLQQPSNINLSNRLGRLTNEDIPAITALQDRATENYLRGMTHAAAWKEAIETAERIKVPEFYVRQEGTRDGRGQYVVSAFGRPSEENIVIRPKVSDRGGYVAKREAQGRMSQENIRARQAATRSVPVLGPVGAAPTPESGSAASTAGATASPVVRRSLRDDPAYVRDYERGWRASRENNGRDGLERADGRGESDAFYDGWSDMAVGEPKWKTTTDKDNEEAAKTDPTVRIDEVRSNVASIYARKPSISREELNRELLSLGVQYSQAEIDAAVRNPRSVDPTVNPLIDPERDSAGSIVGGRALDAMTFDERVVNLSPYMDSIVEVREAVRYAQQRNKVGRDYDIDLTRAEAAAGLRPYSDANDKQNISAQAAATWQRQRDAFDANSGVVPRAEKSIVNEAKTIDEKGARALARSNPERFLRVVAERYFRASGDFAGLKEREAYDELNRYADMIANAKTVPVQDGTVESVLSSIRIKHAGMMGIGQTMMTIRKVLNEEYGR